MKNIDRKRLEGLLASLEAAQCALYSAVYGIVSAAGGEGVRYIRSLRIHGGKWQAVTTDSPEEGWIAAGFSAYDNLTLTLESVARGLLSNI